MVSLVEPLSNKTGRCVTQPRKVEVGYPFFHLLRDVHFGQLGCPVAASLGILWYTSTPSTSMRVLQRCNPFRVYLHIFGSGTGSLLGGRDTTTPGNRQIRLCFWWCHLSRLLVGYFRDFFSAGS